ncbi:hypothetical protein HJG54_15455 [Leptolyngbya sp. NK1-12]|uniref:Uncharacterized protein n=1 Tax=Leptolyngbya sp. NK1-12 TaxID=2547451 RepID=A0AA97AGB6_9CYAN|nr:hypothetical protein [Leptolyngbya sp. NK1-12]WNZ24120.1 hypothetical protein HJG54_15455 [Leptolyngbya sp. NK1-12]
MAWDIQLGVRVLEGVEAKFYLNAMRFVVEYLEEVEELGDELDAETGDSRTERLTPTHLRRSQF